MTLHGHEIPEEFVREVEATVLTSTLERFGIVNLRCCIQFGKSGRELRKALSVVSDAIWSKMADRLADRILQRLKKSGKIEYLGRSQGWRVKR